MFDIAKLNKSQREAVLHTDGPVMVLAGAGSGKTRTLVTRIMYLIEEKKVSTYKILALTFSNKAAREMRERVGRELQVEFGALQITTFHSFCTRLLRSEANYLGLSRNFTIYDDGESKAIVKAILKRKGISQKEVSPNEVRYFIDSIKNVGHYRGRLGELEYELDESDPFFEYYLEYEEELKKANAIDFGGLITAVIELFEKHPKVLESYQDRYGYILIDEYQDTNRAQFDLMIKLGKKNKNICVVGDEDQSIYSWRGADIRNILDFEEFFPEVSVIKLEQNYRSCGNIIEAASAVIARNEMRKGKSMWTSNDHGDLVQIIETENEKSEGDFVARELKSLVAGGTYDYSDIGVFYRTNAQSRAIEDHLRKSNIPYRVVGGIKFYERKEIKDMLAYVRLITNDLDSLALSRIINVPARGIGTTTLRKLETEATKQNVSLLEVIRVIMQDPSQYSHIRLSAKVKSSLNSFLSLIEESQNLEKSEAAPVEIYEKLLYESGYYDTLKAAKDYESIARIENLEELTSAIAQYTDSVPKPSLQGYLETITLDTTMAEEDAFGSDTRGEVSLMTVHGSKGLEFPYVFLVGAEENIFPSFRSLEDAGDGLEEERRLFYVAMTRAMKRLYITFARARMLYGQLKFNGPSRFIHEIPNKLYEWENKSEKSGSRFTNLGSDHNDYSDDDYGDDDYTQKSPARILDEPVYQVNSSHTKQESTYPKNSKIIHSIYGQGKVLETEGLGNEEKVVIKFHDGTKKKFMVKFAPLSLA